MRSDAVIFLTNCYVEYEGHADYFKRLAPTGLVPCPLPFLTWSEYE